MNSNSREIAKLKKKYSKLPMDRGFSVFKTRILTLLPRSLALFILKSFLIESSYKLKRESAKFFELSMRAYGAKKPRKCKRLLYVAIRLISSNFPIHFSALLRDAVALTLKNPSKRGVISDSVLLATKQLESAIFDSTAWYQLSRGLFSLGYIRAAWVARENSLDLSIVEGSTSGSSPTAVRRAIEANLERLNLDSVKRLLSETEVLGTKSLSSFREILQLFEGNYIKKDVIDLSKHDEQALLFHELVTDRKVVLVGPGNPRGEYGIEIDSADIVARIKYPGVEYLLDKIIFGNRCDISQYPGLSPLRELAKISHREYFDDLRLIITGEDNSSPVRHTPVYSENQDMPIYRTNTTSGLRLLISLIRQGPSHLKLFGYDFYSELEPYNSGMKAFYESNGWKMGDGFLLGTKLSYPKSYTTSSFVAHDPVSNFCFAQNLYKAGLFDIEPYGKSILELTPYQYVERLEEMLGDW